jgi:hypothetical protein
MSQCPSRAAVPTAGARQAAEGDDGVRGAPSVGPRRRPRRELLRNCFRVIVKDGGGWLGILIRGNWRATLALALVAWAMFRALRLGGRKAFEAAPKASVPTAYEG